jgi:DNA primase
VCEERTGKADRKGSWSVSLTTGYWSCWKCGASGRLRDFDAPLPAVAEPSPMVPMALPAGFLPLGHGDGRFAEVTRPAREYLARRGVGLTTIREGNIGAVPDWGRVVLPISAPDGTLRGWVARAYIPTDRTYLYPKGFRRADTLYNEACLDVATDVPVLVVEGVFDALACWPDGVAVLGKPSGWQVSRLVAARRPVVVAFDGDAWREGWALAMHLRLQGQTAGCVRLPPGVDPDELSIDLLREKARRSLTETITEV